MKFGRPLKTPELGPRLPFCVRLPLKTLAALRLLAKRRRVSQADVVVDLVSKAQ